MTLISRVRSFYSEHKLEIFIFLLALAARLTLFSVDFAHDHHDLIATIHGDDGYYELSQNILAGHGFSWDASPPYTPNPLRPPVWPYLIALVVKIFGSYWAALALQLILGSFIPVLSYHVVKRIFRDSPQSGRIALWSAAIACLQPYLVLFSTILYTETSFIFFFLIALIFLLRYIERQTMRNAVWSAVFMGLATLIKPTIEYLPILVPIGLAIFWRKSLTRAHLKQCFAFLIVFGALMMPWLYRNRVDFGSWGISAQPAFNLYVYLVPSTLAIQNHTDFQTEYQKYVHPDAFTADTITLANSAYYKDQAEAVLFQHKAALLKLCALSLVTFFTHDGMLTVLQYAGITVPNVIAQPVMSLAAHPTELARAIIHYAESPAIAILVMRLFWIVMTLFFVFGSWRNIKREGWQIETTLALCLIAYFAITTMINGLGVNARFRMPVEMLITGFALYGLFSLKRDNTRTDIPERSA